MSSILKGTEKNPIGVLVILGTFVLMANAGCGSKEVRYPEDHARYQRVIQAIKTLENAYVNQDASKIHELLLPLQSLHILESATRKDFATFDTIQLKLTIDRILVDGDHSTAFVSWQGTWKSGSSEAPVEASGHGVLFWSGNQVILLRGTEGDIPFGMASRLNISSSIL